MARFTPAELEQRVLDGLPHELELFGTSAESSRVDRVGEVIASIVPAAPDRSLMNSIYAPDPADLAGAIEELEEVYERASVRASLVWLPGGDELGPALLEQRGYVHDGSPRSMGLDLRDLREPARSVPDGVTVLGGEIREAAAINDRAYGYSRPSWAAALKRPPRVPISWAVAVWDGEPVACAAAISSEDGDAQITCVATVPERRGHGLAGRLVHSLLVKARDGGAVTGTLQASRAGAPVYERLGFRDVGHLDLWEKRTP